MAKHGEHVKSGELEAFDTHAELEETDALPSPIVGQIYTSEEMIGRVGTWQALKGGKWEFMGAPEDE